MQKINMGRRIKKFIFLSTPPDLGNLTSSFSHFPSSSFSFHLPLTLFLFTSSLPPSYYYTKVIVVSRTSSSGEREIDKEIEKKEKKSKKEKDVYQSTIAYLI